MEVADELGAFSLIKISDLFGVSPPLPKIFPGLMNYA